MMGYILGLYWDNGKENGNYRDYRDYNGVYIGYTHRMLHRGPNTLVSTPTLILGS